MSEIFHQSLTGGWKANVPAHCEKFLSMLKNHPDAANDSNIPPICDGWFLTEKNNFFKNKIFCLKINYKLYFLE